MNKETIVEEVIYLFSIDAIKGVGKKKEESHQEPGPARNGLLVVSARDVGGWPEVVIVEGQQPKVAETEEKANKGEEVGGHPSGAKLHSLKGGIDMMNYYPRDTVWYLPGSRKGASHSYWED